MNLRSTAAGSWRASGVGSGARTTGRGRLYRWVAPATPGRATVTFSASGQADQTTTFTVVAPESVHFYRQGEERFPAGTAGVGMTTRVGFAPFTVSFAAIQWKEDPSGPDAVRDYFEAHTPPSHGRREGAGRWIQNRSGLPDMAVFGGFPSPWTGGSFRWVIPNRYRVGRHGEGEVFATVHQTCTIEGEPNAGRMTVTKGDTRSGTTVASAQRDPGAARAARGRGRARGAGGEAIALGAGEPAGFGLGDGHTSAARRTTPTTPRGSSATSGGESTSGGEAPARGRRGSSAARTSGGEAPAAGRSRSSGARPTGGGAAATETAYHGVHVNAEGHVRFVQVAIPLDLPVGPYCKLTEISFEGAAAYAVEDVDGRSTDSDTTVSAGAVAEGAARGAQAQVAHNIADRLLGAQASVSAAAQFTHTGASIGLGITGGDLEIGGQWRMALPAAALNLVEYEPPGAPRFLVGTLTAPIGPSRRITVDNPGGQPLQLTPRLTVTLKFQPNWPPILARLSRGAAPAAAHAAERATASAAERAAAQAAERAAAEAAEHAASEAAARAATRGGASGALHAAGAVVEPLLILYDFYTCMEHVSSIIPGIQAGRIEGHRVSDYADLVSSWVFGGINQHEARVAMVDHIAPARIAATRGGAGFIQRWRAALRGARQEAQTAFARLRRDQQISVLREQHGTQRALYRALGQGVAQRQGVPFVPDDVERHLDGSVYDSGERVVPASPEAAAAERQRREDHGLIEHPPPAAPMSTRAMTSRPPADRGARLEGNDADGDTILTRMRLGLRVVTSDEPIRLSCGAMASVTDASMRGEHPNTGLTQFRVTLRITAPAPSGERITSGGTTVDNAAGQVLTRMVLGRAVD